MEHVNLNEQATLILIVRKTIEEKLYKASKISLTVPDSLSERRQGAFVTIHEQNTLRGCIGMISTNDSLVDTIKHLAYEAAFEDPRFKPLNKEEYKDISIEISLLEQPRTIKSIEEIVIGKHGLIISLEGSQGLLLPQVALEHKLDKKAFLEHTCMKASLEPNAWEKGANIKIFEAQIFDETML